MDNSLKYTKVARKAIRMHSPLAQLYTNKYPKCRTIKTYSADRDGSLRAYVASVLHAAGCEDFSIKVRPFHRFFSTDHSFIVRFPR